MFLSLVSDPLHNDLGGRGSSKIAPAIERKINNHADPQESLTEGVK